MRSLTGPRQAELFGKLPSGHRTTAERQTRRLLCSDGELQFQLRRSRRKTIGFRVDEGGLTVAAPGWLALADIEKTIISKLPWIRRTLAAWSMRSCEAVNVEWKAGAKVSWLGGSLVIELQADTDQPFLKVAPPDDLSSCGQPGIANQYLTRDRLVLPLSSSASSDDIRLVAINWLQGEARRVFAIRLAELAPKMHLSIGQWKLSSARRRWGSCSINGSIRLNWRLILFPMWIIDYVLIHELAHRHEMNHGVRFWALVAAACPQWKLAECWLKLEAPKILGVSYD